MDWLNVEFKIYWFKLRPDPNKSRTMLVMCIAQNYDGKTGELDTSIPCPYQDIAEANGYSLKIASPQMAKRIKEEFLVELPYDAQMRADRFSRTIVPFAENA